MSQHILLTQNLSQRLHTIKSQAFGSILNFLSRTFSFFYSLIKTYMDFFPHIFYILTLINEEVRKRLRQNLYRHTLIRTRDYTNKNASLNNIPRAKQRLDNTRLLGNFITVVCCQLGSQNTQDLHSRIKDHAAIQASQANHDGRYYSISILILFYSTPFH